MKGFQKLDNERFSRSKRGEISSEREFKQPDLPPPRQQREIVVDIFGDDGDDGGEEPGKR
jgi:hypothetical protein